MFRRHSCRQCSILTFCAKQSQVQKGYLNNRCQRQRGGADCSSCCKLKHVLLLLSHLKIEMLQQITLPAISTLLKNVPIQKCSRRSDDTTISLYFLLFYESVKVYV